MPEPAFDLDDYIRSMIRWHFDPETGSPYWLRRAATLGFDPLTDVQGFDDLTRFPPVADEWRAVPARDLIPRGLQADFDVWETGGTTGVPRRIVDASERGKILERLDGMLDQHRFPGGGDWLHVGPTGPHLVGTTMARLARRRGSLFHTIDLDPRWVKKLYRGGRADEARRYVAHITEQVVDVLRSQPVGILSVTPPLLQALCENPESYRLLAERLRGLIWTGTSLGEEALRLLEEELLPDAVAVGFYGNTLVGISCQRPREPGDAYRCIFTPPSPQGFIRLVDPTGTRREVGYGEVGQVRISSINPELFLPWHLERDQAVRVPPGSFSPWDGLARVLPLQGAGPQVEGVY